SPRYIVSLPREPPSFAAAAVLCDGELRDTRNAAAVSWSGKGVLEGHLSDACKATGDNAGSIGWRQRVWRRRTQLRRVDVPVEFDGLHLESLRVVAVARQTLEALDRPRRTGLG